MHRPIFAIKAGWSGWWSLAHDNRFHVLFLSHDGRSIGEDCRDYAEEIVGNAVALRR